MEFAVPSFVITALGRCLLRTTDCFRPVDNWIQVNPAAAHQPPGYTRMRQGRVLDIRNIKQLRRFYVAEVFQPQPPIAGSQRAETVLSQWERLCSETLYTTSHPYAHRRGKPFNSHAVSISLHPSLPTMDGVSIEVLDESIIYQAGVIAGFPVFQRAGDRRTIRA